MYYLIYLLRFPSHLQLVLLAEGEDFEPIFQNVTFQPQQSTVQEVELKIVVDDTVEGAENLMLIVTGVSGQQTAVPINITIVDGTSMHNTV